jgi:hypothetical protein
MEERREGRESDLQRKRGEEGERREGGDEVEEDGGRRGEEGGRTRWKRMEGGEGRREGGERLFTDGGVSKPYGENNDAAGIGAQPEEQ